jgi:hypothetical protein
MTIVRVGLGETARYGEGWEAIFRKKSKQVKKAKPSATNKKKAKALKKKK